MQAATFGSSGPYKPLTLRQNLMNLIDARNVRTSLDKQYNLLKVKVHVQQSLTTENQTKIHVNMISMIRHTVLAKSSY